MKNQQGFSLKELLIIFMLIGLVAAIGIPNLLEARRSANTASALQTLRNLNTAQVTYSLGIGRGNYANRLALLGGSASTDVGFLDNTVTASSVEDGSPLEADLRGDSHSGFPQTGNTGNTGDYTRYGAKPVVETRQDRIPQPAIWRNGALTPAPEIRLKIIKNAQINLVVKAFEPFSSSFEKQVAATGGYIAQSQVTRGTGAISSASITVRVPPDQLDLLVSWLRDQGIVTSENIKADDISEQYYDLKARLENSRRFEARLLDMLKTQTGTLEDVVRVEEKLNQVREQTEQFEGKLRYFDNLVGLSTLAINVTVEEHYVSPQEPTFGEQVQKVWGNSWQGLKEMAQGIGLVVIGLVPWLIPLAILLTVVWFGVKLCWKLWEKYKAKLGIEN